MMEPALLEVPPKPLEVVVVLAGGGPKPVEGRMGLEPLDEGLAGEPPRPPPPPPPASRCLRYSSEMAVMAGCSLSIGSGLDLSSPAFSAARSIKLRLWTEISLGSIIPFLL